MRGALLSMTGLAFERQASWHTGEGIYMTETDLIGTEPSKSEVDREMLFTAACVDVRDLAIVMLL